MVKRVGRALPLAALALAWGGPARAEQKEQGGQKVRAEERGVLWEQTVEMQMQGMAMPATTSQVCAPQDLEQPPGAPNGEKCTVSDVRNAGTRMTWKMDCTSPEAMTIDGEMVRAKDGYTGRMTIHSAKNGDIAMKTRGRLLGTPCDPGEAKRKVDAMQKQANQQMAEGQRLQREQQQALAKACDDAAERMTLQFFVGPSAMCKERALTARFCARFPTREGFVALRAQGEDAVPTAGKLCDVDPEPVRARLCKEADAEARGSKTTSGATLRFLGYSCPVEARALASRECAGRSYTGLPSSFRPFCVANAQGDMEQPRPAEERSAAEEKPADKVKKTLLKGLFGK
jgi:hypothetical protein